MQITLSVNVGGMEQRLLAIAAAVEDLDPVLKQFGSYLLAKFRQSNSGWAPRAKSTEKQHESSQQRTEDKISEVALSQMRSKLRRDLRRAKSKFGHAAQARRFEVLREFERIVTGKDIGFSKTSQDDRAKIAKKLFARVNRAFGKAEGKVLGRLPASLKKKVSKHTLTVGSAIEWAGVHNQGGTAGHGARIPQREFVYLTDEDIGVLKILIDEYALLYVGGKSLAPRAGE